MDLESHLLKPMQRVTKMPLLLRQILKYTPENHPDRLDLIEAARVIDDILAKINTAAGARAEAARLHQAQKTVAGHLGDVLPSNCRIILLIMFSLIDVWCALLQRVDASVDRRRIGEPRRHRREPPSLRL